MTTRLRLAAGVCGVSTVLFVGGAGGAIASADTGSEGSRNHSSAGSQSSAGAVKRPSKAIADTAKVTAKVHSRQDRESEPDPGPRPAAIRDLRADDAESPHGGSGCRQDDTRACRDAFGACRDAFGACRDTNGDGVAERSSGACRERNFGACRDAFGPAATAPAATAPAALPVSNGQSTTEPVPATLLNHPQHRTPGDNHRNQPGNNHHNQPGNNHHNQPGNNHHNQPGNNHHNHSRLYHHSRRDLTRASPGQDSVGAGIGMAADHRGPARTHLDRDLVNRGAGQNFGRGSCISSSADHIPSQF